jgi:hypothetical protein
MKNRLHRIALALLVCALIQTAALAGGRSYNVSFKQDVTVGDTLVKQGDYRVSYDDEAKEVHVIRGNKVIARANATLEEDKSTSKYKPVYRTLKNNGGDVLLLAVEVGGKYAVLSSNKIAEARTASSAGQ